LNRKLGWVKNAARVTNNLGRDGPTVTMTDGMAPMRYMMRQKVFCWGDDYLIQDEAGRDVFLVDGKVFTLGQKLSFQDTRGRELAFIRQRLLAWGPTFQIERDGRVVAEVRKHVFTVFLCKFTVDVPGPDDLEATGSLFDYEYEFQRGGQTVATVSKRWFAFSDTYGVEIAPGEDDILILASTVVIDLACHGDQGSE
jgi:uncharacterized protein YxjI